MQRPSIFKTFYWKTSKLSILFSFLLVFANVVIMYRAQVNDKNKDVSNRISSFLNSTDFDILEFSAPRVLKKLQQKIVISELAISSGCHILASTTLKNNNSCNSFFDFNKVSGSINGKMVDIFYKLDNSFFVFLKDNRRQLTINLIAFILLTSSFLILFVRNSLIRPIQETIERLNQDPGIKQPIEFKLLADKMRELHLSISKYEKEKFKFELAKQVVHDIRNPLLYLKQCCLNDDALSKLRESILAIDYQVENLIPNKINTTHQLNIDELKENLISDTQSMFEVRLDIESSEKYLESHLHYFDIKNILANLIRNSYEAKSTHVVIQIQAIDTESYSIIITDNGQGIDPKIRHKLFKQSQTTKGNGNGIGLLGTARTLSEKGASIEAIPVSSGACFEIRIPKIVKRIESRPIILIDDDKFIHISWKMKAKEFNRTIKCYFSVSDFLNNSMEHSKNSIFFIDSNIGNFEKGEILSKDIYSLGFEEIYLCTSATEIDISPFPWIRGVQSKSPQFLNFKNNPTRLSY